MIKLYGDKGRCWSLYLKSCLEHSSLIIPQLVEPDQGIAKKFRQELAAHVGATLPIDKILQSSRPNYRTCPQNTNVVTSSSVHATNGSGSITRSAQSGGSHRVAIQAQSGMRLVHKPLSSDEHTLKQTFQVDDMAAKNLHTATSTYSHPAIQRSQMGSVQKSRAVTAVEDTNQPKSAAIQTMQESRIDSVDSTISSNVQTIRAHFSPPINRAQLSESPLRQNVKTTLKPGI